MSEPTELTKLLAMWRDHYVEMCKDGADADEAADAMLTFAGLMLEKLRGTPAACTALIAGAEFMTQRARQTSEPSGGARH